MAMAGQPRRCYPPHHRAYLVFNNPANLAVGRWRFSLLVGGSTKGAPHSDDFGTVAYRYFGCVAEMAVVRSGSNDAYSVASGGGALMLSGIIVAGCLGVVMG